jgi:hypothetical protein
MAMVCDIDAFCKRFEQNLQNLRRNHFAPIALIGFQGLV